MKKFKIIFPSFYQVKDVFNDNIDVNIVYENEEVFFVTFFTLLNVKELMLKNKEIYFWATDMVIVKDLDKETIRNVVSKMTEEGSVEQILSKIGTIESLYLEPFDMLKDMTLV
ncbi:hypothetical protein [Apibacter adventoris]|uniref:Uncharacterized protein n=1 Tax=Apibacter adventoris TaxID=1679466 RepID=A0A2S8AEQ7_9FLAO|nr:hypothetical protein [Apibacter adventoris]PQL93777.1 hypothetical protein C4S77_04285 [Apibacter adventoris]